MKLFVLGRESHLSLAELEATSRRVEKLGDELALADCYADFTQLGGSPARAEILADETIAHANIASFVTETITRHIEGAISKVTYGINWYGNAPIGVRKSFGLKLKKHLRSLGVSSRYCTPKKPGANLTTAQIKFNGLLQGQSGFIIYIHRQDEQERCLIGYIDAIQDIDSYSKRDYERPCRAVKVGMLPPKLAQIMINLAGPDAFDTIVDPFCGSGVVLQEALLTSHDAIGSDITDKMVECAKTNLSWLAQEFGTTHHYTITQDDATKITYQIPSSSVIVTEGYLGPIDYFPSDDDVRELEKLYLGFLSHMRKKYLQVRTIVITLPFWQKQEAAHLNILDQIEKLGYNYRRFELADTSELYYSRPDARVGRQILVLEKEDE